MDTPTQAPALTNLDRDRLQAATAFHRRRLGLTPEGQERTTAESLGDVLRRLLATRQKGER